jgi:polyisoprenoid-binding protein YceI
MAVIRIPVARSTTRATTARLVAPGLLACGLLAWLLPSMALAAPATYRLDPVHTRVLFAISHAGFSHALGTVSGSTGTLVFDPQDWSSAKVSVSVPMARLDLGDAGWNRAAGGHGLLDIDKYPAATFVSSRIEPKDPTHAAVCGTLTLHGVGQDVCLQVTFNQLKRLSLPPFHRIAGFSATATLSRKAFGIDAWPSVIGDDVELRIEAEAEPVSTRGGDAPAGVPAPADASTVKAPTTP